ncbi:uncharacterized protein BJ171DRAFT_596656 [Polychytrium aggregatum]|uniref:uncharacterized protein n=1 Tax=Polychytrium aggregatum TaxID=110093 RepID=UPI0022FF337C|nr:uncharacterized protein BJ171DRAFT_596656 [Polychytrium aggregatum]KAI9207658.1 hypothetical protein BJ171DRAFT_596656 [Polychytrium aggregatum]
MSSRSLSVWAIALLAVLAHSWSAWASVCSPSAMPAGIIPNATLVSQSQSWVNNNQNIITIYGTVEILDGCTFIVHNFTFLQAPESYWYGGMVGNTSAAQVVDTPVSSQLGPGDSPKFQLTTAAGRAVSFADFNELRLFVPASSQLVASAVIWKAVATSSAAAPATSSTLSPSGSSAASPSTSAGFKTAISSQLWAFAVLSALAGVFLIK